MDIKQIFENNQNWIAKQLETAATYFEKLAKGQSPEFLDLGCSGAMHQCHQDSRGSKSKQRAKFKSLRLDF